MTRDDDPDPVRPGVYWLMIRSSARFLRTSPASVQIMLVVGCLAVIGPTRASAQVGGSITGTVKDQSGGEVPGVTVTATNTVLGTQVVVSTDTQGFYSLPRLPVGRYDLTFQIEGFKPVKRSAVAVDADANLQINATLEVGE